MDRQNRFGHLELEPDHAGVAKVERTFDEVAYVQRARELEWNGEHEAALRLYARALGHDPHHEGGWVGQLRCLVAAGDFDEAILWAEKAAEYLPRSAAVFAWKAVALARCGRLSEAQETSDKALKCGQSPDVWLARGWVHGTSRPEPAFRCMDKALEQGRQDPGVLLQVARFYEATGRHSAALKVLQELTTLRPALSFPWYLLGQCHARLGMKEQAQQAYEQAIGKAPTRRSYREALTQLQQQGSVGAFFRRLLGR
jgi:tetratricopeptide (TPR) repeat protein